MYDASTLCQICVIIIIKLFCAKFSVQVTVNHYAGLNAVLGPDQVIKFEASADAITLDIPESGVIIAETWKIIPTDETSGNFYHDYIIACHGESTL